MKRKTYRIKPYKAKDGFRWRMKALNGLIVAESGEAYKTRRNVERAIQALLEADIVLVPEHGWSKR